MYDNNIGPTMRSNKRHIGTLECPCGPVVIFHNKETHLLHRVIDADEFIEVIENILGITCYEHMEHVDGSYRVGLPHMHYERPLPIDENKKIDPR